MTPAAELEPAAIAAGALHRLGVLKGAKQGSAFTSDLSVNELLVVLEAGFRPVGLVLGSSVYHVGSQSRSWRVNQELDVLSHALTQARELAMTRMRTGSSGCDWRPGRITSALRTPSSSPSVPRSRPSREQAAESETGGPTLASRSPQTFLVKPSAP